MNTDNEENLLVYDGRLNQMYMIWIKNFILEIVTLGIYRAWAKTRMRKYVYSSFSVLGDRFEYIGTGRELFVAFVKVNIYLFLFFFALALMLWFIMVRGDDETLVPILDWADTIISIIIVFIFTYIAQFTALRYRLARTRWRGIRAGLAGTAQPYVMFRLRRLFLNIITFGYTIPKTDLIARKYIVDRMRLGNQKCTFNGDINALNNINIITLLLAVPTFAISRLWYKAELTRLKWNYMRAGPIYFRCTYTGGQYAWLYMSNLLMVLFSFGFATPIALQRYLNYFSSNVFIFGDIEASNIQQSNLEANAMGEGYESEIADVGLEIDFGLI